MSFAEILEFINLYPPVFEDNFKQFNFSNIFLPHFLSFFFLGFELATYETFCIPLQIHGILFIIFLFFLLLDNFHWSIFKSTGPFLFQLLSVTLSTRGFFFKFNILILQFYNICLVLSNIFFFFFISYSSPVILSMSRVNSFTLLPLVKIVPFEFLFYIFNKI